MRLVRGAASGADTLRLIYMESSLRGEEVVPWTDETEDEKRKQQQASQ